MLPPTRCLPAGRRCVVYEKAGGRSDSFGPRSVSAVNVTTGLGSCRISTQLPVRPHLSRIFWYTPSSRSSCESDVHGCLQSGVLLLDGVSVAVVGDDAAGVGELLVVVGVGRAMMYALTGSSLTTASTRPASMSMKASRMVAYFLISLTPAISSTANWPVVSTCTPTILPSSSAASFTGASLGARDREDAGQIGIGEVDLLLPLGRDAHGRHDDVEAVTHEVGDDAVPSGGDDFQLHAHLLGDGGAQVDVEADIATLTVGELHGRESGVGAGLQDAFLDGLWASR